jgi:hypothetical protein
MMDDEDNITAMLTYTHSSDGDPRHTPGDVVGRVVLDVYRIERAGGSDFYVSRLVKYIAITARIAVRTAGSAKTLLTLLRYYACLIRVSLGSPSPVVAPEQLQPYGAIKRCPNQHRCRIR